MAQLPRLAAAEEDDAALADVLDIDDSDLRFSPPSCSHPLRPSTTAGPHLDKPSRPSHGQRIPGPAAAVQEAMRLRESGVPPVLGRVDAQAADADFLRHPWVCALQFLGKDRAWERPGIKRIKADRELHRAPLVMGIVTSCKPNGLGDLLVTLKDPTDTIHASVHRKVLSERNVGQDISAGCVIILEKVAVFRPSHTACYLNITKGKVVKNLDFACYAVPIPQRQGKHLKLFPKFYGNVEVVRKDCDPPFKQEISSGIIESQLPAVWKETQWVAHLGDRPLGTSEGTASIFSKMVSRTKHCQVADLHSEGGTSNVFHGTILGLDRRSTEGHLQQSFNIPNTCSQPIPGASSVTPGDRACTQASNNEKLRLPFADELMLPSSKMPKTNAVLPDCYDATMNTSIDTKSKHGSKNNMAEHFHGGHSTGKPDVHQQKGFFAANTGTTQPTKETPATDAASNNMSLSHPKRAIPVASVAGQIDWTDEQLSELFADY